MQKGMKLCSSLIKRRKGEFVIGKLEDNMENPKNFGENPKNFGENPKNFGKTQRNLEKPKGIWKTERNLENRKKFWAYQQKLKHASKKIINSATFFLSYPCGSEQIWFEQLQLIKGLG